jgi:hypothetical protein
MTTPHSFPQATFLAQLEQAQTTPVALPGVAPLIADGQLTELGTALLRLLQARQTLHQSALDMALMADELRRYQKFSPAGRPSMQLVQLRRQQSSVQQAARVAKQAFIRTADGFARVAALPVSPKLGLSVAIERWLETHIPAAPQPG